MRPDLFHLMREALKEAEKGLSKGEVPVGAVLARPDGKIVAKAHNQPITRKDPTAHAEMIAITAASNHLSSWRLNNCDIYVTMEPCVMCTGALLNARINSIYFSSFDPKYGACGSLYNLAEEGKYNHKIKLFSGLYSTESEKLLKDFFLKKRNISSN